MKDEKLFEEATKAWGDTAQLLKAIEELSELQRAIARYLILCTGDNIPKNGEHINYDLQISQIIEEVIDVDIMSAQIKTIFRRKSLFEQMREVKMNRIRNLLLQEE